MPAATAEFVIKKDNSTILISPLDPDLIIDEEKNFSRMGDPWDEERLKRLERSLEKHGQLQPCRGYQDSEGKVHLMFGFGRALASKRLAHRLPDWKLKVQLEKHVSDDRAADANVAENHHRRLPNYADMAIGIKNRLEGGYSKEDVAELFSCSVAQVDRLLPLNQLKKKHLDAIREDTLLPSTAIDCLRIRDTELRNRILDKIISEAKRTGERLTSRAARNLITDAHEEHRQQNGYTADTSDEEEEEQTEEQPKQNGRKRRSDILAFPRTVPDIRDFYQNLAASPIYPATVKAFGETMLKWTKGELGKPEKADQLLEEAIEKVFLDNPKGQKNENDEDVSEGWTT